MRAVIRARVVSAGGPVVPAFVQSATADTGAGTAASVTPTLGAGATAGNLLLVAANSDATLTISGGGGGWSLAASAVAAQGTYLWWKLAAGGETSVTLTPSVTDTVAAAVLEFSGIAASSTLDQTATATRSSTLAASQVTGTTAATAQPVELVVCVVGPHSHSQAGITGVTWGTSTARAATYTTGVATGVNVAVLVGTYVTSSTGTQGDTATWSAGLESFDAGGIVATFRGA